MSAKSCFLQEERRSERRLGTPARQSPWSWCSCLGRVGSRHPLGWRLAPLASAMTRPHSAPRHENRCAYTVIHAHKSLHSTLQRTAGAQARVLVTHSHAPHHTTPHPFTPPPPLPSICSEVLWTILLWASARSWYDGDRRVGLLCSVWRGGFWFRLLICNLLAEFSDLQMHHEADRRTDRKFPQVGEEIVQGMLTLPQIVCRTDRRCVSASIWKRSLRAHRLPSVETRPAANGVSYCRHAELSGCDKFC